jgi:hypothetical protein
MKKAAAFFIKNYSACFAARVVMAPSPSPWLIMSDIVALIHRTSGSIRTEIFKKQSDEQRLAELVHTKNALLQLKETEIKLQEYQENSHDLSTGEGKALALDALNIKVYATRDSIDVKGNYPPEYVTIERTLALPHVCSYRCRRA